MLFLSNTHTFQYPHLKNASKCTPRVHGNTHLLTSSCWFLLSYSSLGNGMEAKIPSPPTLLKMPVNTKSRGNYCLQSRESKISCCPFLPSCLVHLQHLACSHVETNTPNLSLDLCEVSRVLPCKAKAWAACGLSFFKLFLFKQQKSVVWVNLVCLQTEPWTAHHILWFFSKDLAPHKPRKKVHEYSTAPSITSWCPCHCAKGKVTGSGDHINAEDFTVWFHSALSAMGVLDEWWLLCCTVPLPCAHDLACPFYLLSEPSSDHLCFCSSTLQPWK